MERFLSWFTTESGRIFTRTCVGFTGATIFSIPIIFHGPMQYKLKEIFQFYEQGKPKPLSQHVKSLVKRVVADCPLKPEEKRNVRFFNVIGFDVHHFGGFNSPWGASVGLPFTFEDSRTINFGALRMVGHETIDWLVEGSDLLEALSLSEKAKKFAMMREIYNCNFWDILDNCFVSAFSFLLPAVLLKKYNHKTNALVARTLGSRIRLYIVTYLGGGVLFKCLKDPLKHISEKKHDRAAASVSLEYLDGGIEYYEKAIMRNKTLRHLMGPKGERKFNEDGSEKFLIFAPRLPLRLRLGFLKDLKQELDTVPA